MVIHYCYFGNIINISPIKSVNIAITIEEFKNLFIF